MTISVNGPAAIHHRLRGWPHAFDKLARTIPALVAERTVAGVAPPLPIAGWPRPF